MAAENRGGVRDSLEYVGSRKSLLNPRLIGSLRVAGLTLGAGAVASAGALGWAHLEAQLPVLREIESGPAGKRGLRVLHLSDIHMHSRARFLVDFLHRVASEHEFDMVVSTGDNLADYESLDMLLEAYRPLLEFPGCFVLGSNDYYAAEAKPWASYLNPLSRLRTVKRSRQEPDLPWVDMAAAFVEAGWVDLGNRVDSLQVPLAGTGLGTGESASTDSVTVALVGVDDPHILRDHLPSTDDIAQVSRTADITIGLTHAPYRRILDGFTQADVDVIFAGHTHGGQLRVPGVGAVVTNADIPRRFARGLHEWLTPDPVTGRPKVSLVNVSAGLGTSPFAPVRFACRPEATLLTIPL